MQQISDGEEVQDVITSLEFLQLHQRGRVIELVVVERSDQTYQIDAVVQWHSKLKTFGSSQGAIRTFRRLDALVRYLRTVGIGRSLVSMEMAPMR